jgi:outer membrane protein OmpA-like peptidoglycan-associated protein
MLRLEPGVGIPLTQPQSSRFDPGGALALKPSLALLPFLDANVTVSGLVLPSKVSGVNAGGAWGGGVGARLHRPFDFTNNTGSGFSAVVPWVDADAQLIGTGPLARPMFSVGVGAEVPTSSARNIWLGPFVRYEQAVDSLDHTPGYDNGDARVLIVGLEIELGPSRAKPTVTPPSPAEPQHADLQVQLLPPPEPPAQPPIRAEEVAQITGTVQFGFDSAVPVAADTLLSSIVSKLAAHPGWNVEIDGHASYENHPWAEKHNNELAVRRAQAVKDALVKGGIPADRLTVKGFGTTKPIAPNDTEAHRSINRRVEFTVTVKLVPAGSAQ